MDSPGQFTPYRRAFRTPHWQALKRPESAVLPSQNPLGPCTHLESPVLTAVRLLSLPFVAKRRLRRSRTDLLVVGSGDSGTLASERSHRCRGVSSHSTRVHGLARRCIGIFPNEIRPARVLPTAGSPLCRVSSRRQHVPSVGTFSPLGRCMQFRSEIRYAEKHVLSPRYVIPAKLDMPDGRDTCSDRLRLPLFHSVCVSTAGSRESRNPADRRS